MRIYISIYIYIYIHIHTMYTCTYFRRAQKMEHLALSPKLSSPLCEPLSISGMGDEGLRISGLGFRLDLGLRASSYLSVRSTT